jgi:tetratricopeptide (TPR) repeat protein
MAELYLLTDGPDKALEIAMKSLEITKSPKISNYNFMIMFKKFIAEIYLIKRDFEAAKMYIEKALMMSRKYGLDYQIMTLYHLYGKYFEEIVISKTSNGITEAQNAMKMYNKSNDIAKELNIDKYMVNNDNAKQSLQVFCQLNDIVID